METEHFGVRFPDRAGRVDLTGVPQRWLRDLLWDHMAGLLRSPGARAPARPSTTRARAGLELGAFLEPTPRRRPRPARLLTAEHMQRFVADQRQRERDGLPSLAITGRQTASRRWSPATPGSVVFNAPASSCAGPWKPAPPSELGLDREFIIAMPVARRRPMRPRRPFPDEVARALADEANLAQLAGEYDPHDRGLRDIWETIMVTGRRVGEVLKLRLDCIGRYGGLAMFWHDQTKVGNYDEAIRIPERLYQLLAARQRKTLAGSSPATAGRPTPASARRWRCSRRTPQPRRPAAAVLPVVPPRLPGLGRRPRHRPLGRPPGPAHPGHQPAARRRDPDPHPPLPRPCLRPDGRALRPPVPFGPGGRPSAGLGRRPGTASPGELLAGEAAPLTREQALALAVDLSRRSTPAEGGFCTFQPVVDGGACPWNLDCHNCDKFVLSGADLLYWRRKREQWRLLAEGAPDDATADYLHAYFEPTARAIDGLEKALAGLGLLDDALALDMRKPQDYFHRVWSTAFRAADLAAAGEDEQDRRGTGGKRVSTGRGPAARRRSTQAALGRVRDAITRLRREKTQVSVAAVGRRAGVSRTFIYDNPDARAAVAAAIAEAGEHRTQILAAQDDEREATWRERALNAEDALKAAHAEITTQRARIGGLLGQVRDLKPNGPRKPSSGSPPRTPPSSSASASSPPTTAPSRRAQGRPLEQQVPRPAHRRPRSPDRPAGIGPRHPISTNNPNKPCSPAASRACSFRHAELPRDHVIIVADM